MALGGNYQNNNSGNNGNNNNNPTYYSRMRIKNYTDNKIIGFNYWKGTLKISISEASQDVGTRPNELASIYMSPTKARILAEGVNRIIASEADNKFGVDTGSGTTKGFIVIGREKGNPFLFISKVNADGTYESSQRYDFNVNANAIFNVKDLNTLKIQKEYMNNVELEEFRDVLIDYARAASGAFAASVHDINYYESNRMNALMRSIANKVGVETRNGNGGSYKNNNFFNGANTEYSDPSANNHSNNNSHSNKYESIDDLEDALE